MFNMYTKTSLANIPKNQKRSLSIQNKTWKCKIKILAVFFSCRCEFVFTNVSKIKADEHWRIFIKDNFLVDRTTFSSCEQKLWLQ